MPVREIEMPKRMFRQGFVVRSDNQEGEENQVRFDLAFSSEDPVERWFGSEILSHDQTDVDLTFIGSGRAPLLIDHRASIDTQIGVVESVSISNGKGRASVRLGKSTKAKEIAHRVADGEIVNVSVGYEPLDVVSIENPESDSPIYRFKWKPLEISLVSIPADFSAGIGRAMPEGAETKTLKLRSKVKAMPVENETRSEDPNTQKAIDKATDSARQAETERVREILAVGSEWNCQGDAEKAIREGQSALEFKSLVLMREGEKRNDKTTAGTDIGLSEKEKRNYSFVRALNALSNPNNRQAQEAAAFEREVSNAAVKQRGKQTDGIVVPSDIMRHRPEIGTRALNTGTTASGGALVGTDLLASSFIDLLRSRAVITQMGARMLNDLDGNISIPRLASGATAYWVGESADITKSQAAFDQVLLSPKTVGAFTDYSKQLLAQASLDVEGLVRDDLAKVIGLEISRVALYGSGTSNQPQGVSAMTGINTVTLASANPTWGEVVDMETAVATDDADVGALGYIISPAMRGGFKQTEKASGTARFIWEDGGTVNGHSAGVTTQVAANNAFFGNWEDILIAMWSGLDLIVDPYTQATNGTIRVVVQQMIDIAGRHPESFCRGATA